MRNRTDGPDISERLNGAHAASDYDALADLFLGEAPAKPVTTNQPPHSTSQVPPPAPSSHADLGTPHGPCCSRVGPIGGAATAKPTTRRIEAVVLGHLPGLGGTWAAQHARVLAHQLADPVCLIRYAGQQLVVEMIWPDDARPQQFPACTDATAALRSAAAHAGAWIIRLQGADEAFAQEWFASVDAAGADRVRLLTGADDPSIVAAYRTLKSWHASTTSPVFSQIARVTIVDPDAARAVAAEARLRKAAASFLDVELAPAERLGAMEPVRATTLYCGPCATNPAQTVALVRTLSRETPRVPHATPASDKPTTAPSAAPSTAPGAASPLPSPAAHEPALVETVSAAAAVRPTVARQATVGQANGQANGQASASNGSTAAHSPAQSPAATSPAAMPASGPSADQIIAMVAQSAALDTLRATTVECPWAAAIILATDHLGEAHAIAFARTQQEIALAVVDLLTAARWCAEHTALLRMAGVSPRAADVTLHLATTLPAAARRVAETGLRVHAAVRVGHAWGAVALS